MSIKIPYMRKDTSTLIALSAAIALLLSSPLLLVNLLLQPVQAQTTLSFRTPTPAEGYDRPTGQEVALTFDGHGTTSTSNPSRADITNGTIQLQADQTYTGKINYGIIDNRTGAGFISFDATINNIDYSVESFCSTSQSNDITVKTGGGQTEADFSGPVECSSSQGGGVDTTQSMAAGSSQDGDRDGIPDSSDRCPNNSHHRCFKEGDTSTTTTTTTHEQQPSSPSSSSSNRTGNQTG
jgi:hypothetical protein